jgi:hypothetical protein
MSGELTTVDAEALPVARVPEQSGRGELAKALGKAQQLCHAVEHDARNEYHKYNYTSSEAIIGEAKRALAESGLALLPVEQTLDGHEKEGESRFELVRKFVLMHESGQSMPIVVHWPVCPEKGRPLDKATAAAATLSLSYLLRDLLLMPRVDEADEVPARDDRPAAKPAAKVPAAKPAPQLPKDGAELEARLRALDAQLSAQSRCAEGELLAYVRHVGDQEHFPKDMVRWDPAHFPAITELVKRWMAKLPPA